MSSITARKEETEQDTKQRLWKTQMLTTNLKLDGLEDAITRLLHMHSESNPERAKEFLPIMQRTYRLIKKLTGERHPDAEGLRQVWGMMVDIEEPVDIEKVEKP